MADNVAITAGAGTNIAADDVSSVYYQYVKLDVGAGGAASHLEDGATPTALLPVSGGRVVRLSQTPTITAGAYGANDAIGGLLTFTNAARVSGGGIIIEAAVLIDNDAEAAPIDLVLFDQTFTNTADNSPFDPSDADLLNVIGVISFGAYTTFNDNSVATRTGIGLAAKLAGTSLFGQLVIRTGPTFTATSDITVILHVRQL